MLPNYPDCPVCGEPDLYRVSGDDIYRVRCADCGWDSGVVAVNVSPAVAVELVAAAVADERAIRDARGMG